MDHGAEVLRRLQAVRDRASFLDFVRALASDRRRVANVLYAGKLYE